MSRLFAWHICWGVALKMGRGRTLHCQCVEKAWKWNLQSKPQSVASQITRNFWLEGRCFFLLHQFLLKCILRALSQTYELIVCTCVCARVRVFTCACVHSHMYVHVCGDGVCIHLGVHVYRGQRLSGPKETQDKWLTVEPISMPKHMYQWQSPC